MQLCALTRIDDAGLCKSCFFWDQVSDEDFQPQQCEENLLPLDEIFKRVSDQARGDFLVAKLYMMY